MIKDLEVILREGESYTVEFKESPDKSLSSEVCAFANASGGRIFIGVSDKSKIVGTDTGNAARSRIQDTINQIEPRLMVDITVHDNIMMITVPEGALREAIINAVCHRNYFEKGARVTVEIYDDRVEIISPGGICKGIMPENFGKISIKRNSVIASMLFRIDYIEQMGTGILRMKNAAKNANVIEPKFDLHDFFKVTFERNQTNYNELAI